MKKSGKPVVGTHFPDASRHTGLAITLAFALLVSASALQAADWRVCANLDSEETCELRGYPGLQQAVDNAADGDRVILEPGIYHPEVFYDVTYDELVIRGGVLVEGKTLEILGEPGAILDGSQGPPVSALLIQNSTVQVSGLEIRDFRLAEAEDDLYDGHGIFIINSEVSVRDTQISHIPKMSVSMFGDSKVTLTRVRVVNGHVGIWAEGEVALRIENSVFSNNDSASMAAYDHSHTEIFNSVFENSQDDGVYAKENATVSVINSFFIGNKPYAIRAEDGATITVNYSSFFANEALFFPESDSTQLQAGDYIYLEDPGLDSDYRPGNVLPSSTGDPSIQNRDGSVSDIGLYGGPSAPET